MKNKFIELEVPVSQIYVGEQLRQVYDERKILGLSDSIAEHGLFYRTICELLPDGRYKIWAGYRRFLALVKLGVKKIPILVPKNPEQVDFRKIAIIENKQREPIPAIFMADFYKSFYADGSTTAQIAESLGESEKEIKEYLRIVQDLPTGILEELRKMEPSRSKQFSRRFLSEYSKLGRAGAIKHWNEAKVNTTISWLNKVKAQFVVADKKSKRERVVEQAKIAKKLNQQGFSNQEIADRLDVTKVTAKKRVVQSKATPKVRKAYLAGDVDESDLMAVVITKDQTAALNEALKNSPTTRMLSRVFTQIKNLRKELNKVSKKSLSSRDKKNLKFILQELTIDIETTINGGVF